MMTRRFDAPTHAALLDLAPSAPDWAIDWPAIWGLWPEFNALDACPQDPIHHGEGDVGTHTRMVVEALVADPDWRDLPEDERTALFWAACLHDIGKPAVTRHEEDGCITSRGHSRVGAQMARGLLWRAESPFAWREAICGIILAHQLPFWLLERPDPARLAIETSWRCQADHLCLHAKADATGRICADQAAVLDNVALSREQFAESGCLDGPFPFANDESRVAFFENEDRDPHYAAHEAFRCEVTLLSGLPGSGKDTWIARNAPETPVVSLDAIRREIKAPATGDQGAVIQAAYEAARGHLRAGRDFVWNATNITRQIRAKALRLVRDYGARSRIVYIEAPPPRLFAQNAARAEAIPVAALEALARKLEPPQLWEAHGVERVLLSKIP